MPYTDAEYPRRSRVVVEVYNGVAKANRGTRGVAFVCGESDANARLIAAAPELLRAAKIAATMMGGDDDGPDDDELHDVWLVVRSAIAKAEGQGSATCEG